MHVSLGWRLISAVATTSRLASAQTFSEQARSLRLAPVDAAFYSANLRMKEQWDIITASKAYARLLQIPLVQGAKLYVEFQLQESPEPTIAQDSRICFFGPRERSNRAREGYVFR